MAEEFSSVHVLHLRGNARTSGERRRAEGGNVFGGGSRAPVAITIFVKNPNATHDGCKIHYRDIGDYLTCEQKLEALRETVSIKGFSDWQAITPDKHHDWIGQCSDVFAKFYPLGSEEARAGIADDAIFKLYSLGVATNRDAYVYKFSRDVCAENAQRMTQSYLDALQELEDNPELAVEELVRQHTSGIKWDDTLKNRLQQKKKTEFKDGYIRKVTYRPFIATNCYADYTFITRKGQVDSIFPDASSENRVICVPGKGLKSPFSALITNTMTDLNFCEAGARCFPRWRYPRPADASNTTGTFQGFDEAPERIDNISDTALRAFRNHYHDDTITKDDIFDYVYGILHAPSYRERVRKRFIQDDTAHPVCPQLSRLRRSRTTPRRPPPQLRDLRTIPTI